MTCRPALTKIIFAGFTWAVLFTAAAWSQEPAGNSTGALDQDERMAWWREARFGMFIHWGLYAIPAGQWNSETHHAEWIRTTAEIPTDRYDRLVHQFNPVDYRPEEWARLAKQAGMKYLTITSKHHDGFCLWPSKHTEFDVASTPYGKDLLGPLKDACEKHGIRLCFYHSIMDWHHSDYLPRRDWERDDRPPGDADFERYVAYMKGQLAELTENYGPLGVLWFDGEWERTWNHERGEDLFHYVRGLQPDILINNRVDVGRAGMVGFNKEGKYCGDFGTPEQEIPATGVPGVDWETCMTMNNHWGWNKHDRGWKSTQDLIRKLIDIASKGGNFLLNVGPKADGTFPDEAIERLQEIGTWMQVHGDAIHGTQASPFKRLVWGRCTQKRLADGGTRLFLHVFDWPADGQLIVPGLGNEVRRANLLVSPETELPAFRDASDVVIRVPAQPHNHLATVVVLDVDGPPVIYDPPVIKAAADGFVSPLQVSLSASPGIELRYTLDGSTPTTSSTPYRGPFLIGQTCTVTAVGLHRSKVVTSTASTTFHRLEPQASEHGLSLAPGLQLQTFHGDWDQLPDFASLQAADERVVTTIGPAGGSRRERLGQRFYGYLRVAVDDAYRFELESDDGATLYVGGKLVVDNDGLHSPQTKAGVAALAEGAHPIEVRYFNKTGGAVLDLRCGRVGQPLRKIDVNQLGHQPP